jgi:hypothetical protein
MALNFPSSPVLDQVFTSGTRSWRFDGTGWVAVPAAGGGGPWRRARNELWHVALAAAMTVAAPTSALNGTRLTITSGTNFAHVVTFTGSTLLDGTTGANLTATMTAFAGSTLVVEARGTNWYLISSSNVTSITA